MSIVQVCELIRFILVVSNCTRNSIEKKLHFSNVQSATNSSTGKNTGKKRRKEVELLVQTREMCDANSGSDIKCQC